MEGSFQDCSVKTGGNLETAACSVCWCEEFEVARHLYRKWCLWPVAHVSDTPYCSGAFRYGQGLNGLEKSLVAPSCLHSADDHSRFVGLAESKPWWVFDFNTDMPVVGFGGLAEG